MNFDSLPLLLLAPLLAVLAGTLAWLVRRARLRATALWVPTAGRPPEPAGRWLPFLVGAAALIAGLGAAGPRVGRTEAQLEGRALNLAIAIDISRSMLAEDVAPNRLQRALGEAQRLVQDSRGDRLALLAFAGRSYILTPLTLDDAAVALQLDALDPEIASEGGTALAEVLIQGRELLTAAAEGGSRVLVVFTDGELHDSLTGAVAAARQLAAAGITLVVAGAGDTLPVRIPLRDDAGALQGFKSDPEGRVVRTWRRDEVLRAVTDAGRGTLVSGAVTDQAGAVSRIVHGLERAATRERRREDLTPRAWLFALGAALVLVAQVLLRRGPALAVLAIGLLPAAAPAQRPAAGDVYVQRRDYWRAARAYVEEFRRRPSDTARFNAGTAALHQRDVAMASQWLEQASRTLDPELRFRALYNLGVAYLAAAGSDSARRAELRRDAAARLREALLLDPGNRDAKWNLELAQEPNPPPSGSGGARPPPQPTGQRPEPRPPSGSAISQAEAEQILNSVERRERDVRAEQSRRRRVPSAMGKDW